MAVTDQFLITSGLRIAHHIIAELRGYCLTVLKAAGCCHVHPLWTRKNRPIRRLVEHPGIPTPEEGSSRIIRTRRIRRVHPSEPVR